MNSPTVVLDPSVLVQAILGGRPDQALASWRDGRLRLAMSRRALAAHLRALSLLGSSEELLARWGIWFVHRTGIVWDEGGISPDSIPQEFLRLGRAHGGELVTARPATYVGLDSSGVRLVAPRL